MHLHDDAGDTVDCLYVPHCCRDSSLYSTWDNGMWYVTTGGEMDEYIAIPLALCIQYYRR